MSDKTENQNSANIGKLFDNYHNLDKSLARLVVVVEEGFKGVHARQDTTNGRIKKSEDKIVNLEHTDSKLENRVETLLGIHDKQEEKSANTSNRIQSIFFSAVEKILWITVGVILLNGKKIYELLF